jgi:short-subunit dehydrogenase
MEIAGSRILLTGATGGLGRAIAKALHDKGAHLVLTARKHAALEGLATDLGGTRAEALAADLANRDDVAALPARAGRVDILIHNAALPGSGRLETYTPEQIDRVLDVNLRAGIMLTHALLPGMLERGRGHLVYVSSMSGKIPTIRASIYAATKYGLRGFAGGLRDDLHGTPVGVSAVFPGPITGAGMWAKAGVDLPRWVPKRTPQQVGAAVVESIERDKPELDVADPVQKSGAIMAALAPAFAARVRRLLPVEDLADRTAEAQRAQR